MNGMNATSRIQNNLFNPSKSRRKISIMAITGSNIPTSLVISQMSKKIESIM